MTDTPTRDETMIDTAALRLLYEKAPAGEWWVDQRANLLWTRDHKGPYTIAESRGWGHYTGPLGLPDEAAIAIEHATLEFAAQAHNSFPALLDEIDRLRAEVAAAQLEQLRPIEDGARLYTRPASRTVTEAERGEIAYALTKRLVIDMPTARAAVDEALTAAMEPLEYLGGSDE